MKRYEGFIEVYIKADIEECKSRDPKGLYAKVANGEIKNFTGIDDPYEEPENPDVVIQTDMFDLATCFNQLLEGIQAATLDVEVDREMRKHFNLGKMIEVAISEQEIDSAHRPDGQS